MQPELRGFVIDGASRHSIQKGFLLLKADLQLAEEEKCALVLNRAAQRLAGESSLAGYAIKGSRLHPACLRLETPFLPVYTVAQRDLFVQRLAKASSILLQCTRERQCVLAVAGVNPYCKEAEEQPQALCSDIHLVEVYDEGEIERIYNLYRQFLPELLAISTHSAVYGGEVQGYASLRMKVNPRSYLPHYIAQYSTRQLANLREMVRKEHGLEDLNQMDINPLVNENILHQPQHSLLTNTTAAIALRFIDAQCSFPFIRAQIILLQALAMYGRMLARKGRRLWHMHDEIIDENKALALQRGPTAVLKPAKGLKSGEEYSFHQQGQPQTATTALLMSFEGRVLTERLRRLSCESWELLPIFGGAQLRRQGLSCFANYAEYQQYLCNTQKEQFTMLLQKQTTQLLSSSFFDIISEYNTELHEAEMQQIEEQWTERLQNRHRESVPSGQHSGLPARRRV